MMRWPSFLLCAAAILQQAFGRSELESTPYPCKAKYDDSDIQGWVSSHLSGAKPATGVPHMLLLLGGSGAGKGTFINAWKDQDTKSEPGDALIKDFVFHGLDEYLDYVPEYKKTIEDKESVYKDAADACYPGAAIPAAREALKQIVATKINTIYEETGKNLDRIKKRVLPPFADAGFRITVVMIDNTPDIAIQRSAGRFQATGRYAADDYIKGTFKGSFQSYLALKELASVSEAAYCDNSGLEMQCWGELSKGSPLVPQHMLKPGSPKYMGEISGSRPEL